MDVMCWERARSEAGDDFTALEQDKERTLRDFQEAHQRSKLNQTPALSRCALGTARGTGRGGRVAHRISPNLLR